MISTTNRKRDPRPRGAMRWVPATLALLALAAVCGVLGAYLLAPMLSAPAPGPEAIATAAPTAPDRPVVSYPSGANQVKIVEKPIAPPPPALSVNEPESGFSLSVEPSEEIAGVAGLRRGERERRGEPAPDTPRATSRAPAESAGSGTPAPAAVPAPPATDPGIPLEPGSGLTAVAGAGEGKPRTSEARPAGQAPADPRPSTPDPRPLTTDHRLYRVQVGRFAEESDARALAEELKRDGLSPTVVRSGPEGKGLYRVQVGTFRQRENADKALEALRRKQLEPYLAEEEP